MNLQQIKGGGGAEEVAVAVVSDGDFLLEDRSAFAMSLKRWHAMQPTGETRLKDRRFLDH